MCMQIGKVRDSVSFLVFVHNIPRVHKVSRPYVLLIILISVHDVYSQSINYVTAFLSLV